MDPFEIELAFKVTAVLATLAGVIGFTLGAWVF